MPLWLQHQGELVLPFTNWNTLKRRTYTLPGQHGRVGPVHRGIGNTWGKWEKLPLGYKSPRAAVGPTFTILGRKGSAPCLGSIIEPTLFAEMRVNHPQSSKQGGIVPCAPLLITHLPWNGMGGQRFPSPRSTPEAVKGRALSITHLLCGDMGEGKIPIPTPWLEELELRSKEHELSLVLISYSTQEEWMLYLYWAIE